jgi:hypothetical protein
MKKATGRPVAFFVPQEDAQMGETWTFEHSVECPVAREFAWRFWTNVDNWKLDADVEAVELNGPFAAGSRGATLTRSSGRIEWRLVSVEPEAEAVIEIAFAHRHPSLSLSIRRPGRQNANDPTR